MVYEISKVLKRHTRKLFFEKKEKVMFIAKKIIALNAIIGGAVLATVGTAAVAYVLTNPTCRDKLRDCKDKLRHCKSKMCSRSPDTNGTQTG